MIPFKIHVISIVIRSVETSRQKYSLKEYVGILSVIKTIERKKNRNTLKTPVPF